MHNLLTFNFWVGLGWVVFKVVDVGWVKQVVGWVGSGQDNWTHGHLCGILNITVELMFIVRKLKSYTIK